MADSVARVKILAQIEGLEGFDKLKGAFRGLQQAIGPAESELAKARKQILAFGEAGAKSEQAIKGQVEALKALQSQATIGSNVYRQLGKDVKTLGGAYKEAATGVKEFTDAQLKSQIVGSKPSTFGKQVAALKRDLQDLSVYSQQYTDKLTEIQRRQLPFNTALGRQGVIAAAEAYSQGGKGGSAQPALPDTTAALNQRMTELGAELVNVTRGGEAWIRVSREMAAVQRQLNQEFANPAVEAARRRLEASRNTASGFLQFSTGLEDRIAAQGSIERNRRKREREAAALSGPMQDRPLAPSELFQNIAGIGNQVAANQLQLMGRSYREVAESIRQTAGASDGSLGSLQRQRAAWEQLRATISPLDKEYAQIEREARKAISAIDGQIGRRQIGGRGGAAQIGQGLGAVAASGIFGGPEGFLGSAGGAAIGALVGGPAGLATGAFIGGSVGAYGGMGRQALGGMSTYAADISKLEIALKGVTKTQQEYQRALAASAAVTRDFNVPQLEATRGMTQLSAAVIGAGGKVADAEVVFRNVTAAIKASGGTSEDVQGALTALGQVFSKGKVSAEELQGQLGERLPGAVTMFAKATGRTLPQLQKDLEQGVVGLADLMKFVVSEQGLGQFETRAKAVASSSADAGARLTATWNDTRRAIGEALLPLGAQIQDSLGQALRDATPALIEFARGLAAAVRLVVENAGAIVAVGKALLGVGAIAATGFGFVKVAGLIGTVTTAVTQLGGAMGVATLATRGLSVAMLGIPGIGWIGAAVAGLALLTQAVYDNNDTFKNWVDNIGTVVASDFKTAIDGMKEEARSVFDFIGDLLPDYEKKTAQSQANVSDGWGEAFKSIRDGALGFVTDIQNAFASLFDNLPPWARKILIDNASGTSAGLAFKIANYVKGASGRAVAIGEATQAAKTGMYGKYAAPEQQQTIKQPTGLTDFSTESGKGDLDRKALDKARKDAEQLAAEQQRLAEANAQAQIRLSEALFKAQTDLDRKRFDLQQELINKERDLRIAALTGVAAETASQTAQFFRTIDELRQRTKQATVDAAGSQRTLRNAQFMNTVTSLGAGSGSLRVGGFTTQQLSNATAAASKFTGIANMCSESVKAFYGSLGISLPGVTAWADTVRKAGTVMRDWSKLQPGDIVATGRPGDTPHVGVYTGGNNVFHQSRSRGLQAGNYPDLDYFRSGGYFVRPSATGGKLPAGQAGQMRRNAADQGDVAIAQVDFDMAVKYKALLEEMVQKRLPQEVQLFALEGAKAYNSQAQALRDNVAELQKRQELELSGARQEVVDGELKKSELARDYSRQIAQLNDDLKLKEVLEDPTGVKAEAIKLKIAAITQGYADQKTAIEELTAAQIAFNDAQRFGQDTNIGAGIREGAQQYVESIGTMREASAQLAQTGIKGVEDAIFSLVTTGKANFREFAADILKQTARMIIQQMVLRVVMQAVGFLGGGGGFSPLSNLQATSFGFNPGAMTGSLTPGGLFAKGGMFAKSGIVPYAMGGVVDKPTLFKFANGGAMRTGLMGEAGPEAIIPLKRGPDGKLGVSGGSGTTNVTVNVDASGNSQASGNAGQGEQLGRAISQAVQAELVRQKRPGGLLAA